MKSFPDWYIPLGIDSQISTLWKFSGHTSEQCSEKLLIQKTMSPTFIKKAFLEESIVTDKLPHLTPTPLCDPKDL